MERACFLEYGGQESLIGAGFQDISDANSWNFIRITDLFLISLLIALVATKLWPKLRSRILASPRRRNAPPGQSESAARQG